MKILFWSEKYLPDIGGVEVFGASLMGELAKRGHEFSVVTCRSSVAQAEHEVIDGVSVFRFGFHKPLYNNDLAGVARLCREVSELKQQLRPDVLHMNTTQPSIFFHIHTIKSYECPMLVTIHSPPTFADGPHSLYGRLLREAHRVTAVSNATRESLIDAIPNVAANTVTIHNGLEAPDIVPEPLDFDPIHIACAGRIVEEKGFDVALRAFRILFETHPTARMTIAGDGPELSNLQQLAVELEITDSVVFPGWIDRESIPAFMNTASMVVVPSRWQEPFGLVALQGSQVGRPIIVANVGGLPEVITHQETGLVVEPENPGALAEAMLTTAGDQPMARRLGEEGRRRALRRFTLTRCADEYERMFQEVLSESTPTSV